MRITVLLCDEDADLHIWIRHRVTFREVEEAAYRHGLAIRGRERSVYEVFGRTDAGRYLMVVIRYLGKGEARLITAREMSAMEKRRYLRQTAH